MLIKIDIGVTITYHLLLIGGIKGQFFEIVWFWTKKIKNNSSNWIGEI